MPDFSPLNSLEVALQRAKSGELSLQEFLRVLVDSDIAVPSGSEIMSDGSGFVPLLFDKNEVKMVACFTAKERVGSFANLAPYCLVIKSREFLRRVPPRHGLVINPGQEVGLDITPEGLGRIVRDFA